MKNATEKQYNFIVKLSKKDETFLTAFPNFNSFNVSVEDASILISFYQNGGKSYNSLLEKQKQDKEASIERAKKRVEFEQATLPSYKKAKKDLSLKFVEVKCAETDVLLGWEVEEYKESSWKHSGKNHYHYRTHRFWFQDVNGNIFEMDSNIKYTNVKGHTYIRCYKVHNIHSCICDYGGYANGLEGILYVKDVKNSGFLANVGVYAFSNIDFMLEKTNKSTIERDIRHIKMYGYSELVQAR